MSEQRETTSGTVLAVATVAVGDELAADAATGSTTITVTDAADFAESGGTLSINGQLTDYTDCDDATGLINLVDALTSDASAGDQVYLADPAGKLASEMRATVQVVGALDSDEPIEAVIAHPIVPLLPEGIRDPGTGESVTLDLLPGEEWQLVNVHGRKPLFDRLSYDSVPSFPAVTLSLSTTDAAANDLAIDAAIRALGGRNGTIYAPACPSVGGHDTVWPIAAAHDFQNCDLVGAGAGVYSGALPGSGAEVTVFYCTTQVAGFAFPGTGCVTGGFQINGGAVARQPFTRQLSAGGGDTGRIFQNLYVLNNAPGPAVGHHDGIITTWGYLTSLTITVTNGAGVETTAALPMRATTAADLQAAVEALANVGAGNFAASSRDLVNGTPVAGGPYEFSFDNDASDSVLTLAFTYNSGLGGGGAAVIGQRNSDHALAVISTYLDTFINFGTAQAAEHGLLLDGTFNSTFINFTADFAAGDALVLSNCGLVKFVSGDIEVPIGSCVFATRSDFQIDGMSFYQNFSDNTPLAIIGDTSDGAQLSNVFFKGTGGPYANPGATAVYLEDGAAVQTLGSLKLSNFPGALAVLADTNCILDHKAFCAFTIDYGPPEIVLINGATEEQGRARLQTGLIAAGPIGLPIYATADRPTVTTAGAMVWDSDLAKPIWSDGSGGWVDAAGASA